MPDKVGSYPAGSLYIANDVSALMWVHATLVDTALRAYELVFPPVSAETRERYYTDCRLMGALFGIPTEAQPPNWAGLASYIEATLASDTLAVGVTGREIATRVLGGAGRLPVPSWYKSLTTTLLPEQLRGGFGQPLEDEDHRRAAWALAIIRRVYPLLPSRIRTVGPYQEALGRLSGQTRPSGPTRALNRIWIGRTSMPG